MSVQVPQCVSSACPKLSGRSINVLRAGRRSWTILTVAERGESGERAKGALGRNRTDPLGRTGSLAFLVRPVPHPSRSPGPRSSVEVVREMQTTTTTTSPYCPPPAYGYSTRSLPATRSSSPSRRGGSPKSAIAIPLPPTSSTSCAPSRSPYNPSSSLPSPGPRMHRLGSFPSLTPLSSLSLPPSSPTAGGTPDAQAHHRAHALPPPPSHARSYPPPAGTYFYGLGGTDPLLEERRDGVKHRSR
jgi:hypothetical protein